MVCSFSTPETRPVQVARVPMPSGSILGLPGLVSDNPYSMSAVAKKGATVGFVSLNDFSALMFTERLR